MILQRFYEDGWRPANPIISRGQLDDGTSECRDANNWIILYGPVSYQDPHLPSWNAVVWGNPRVSKVAPDIGQFQARKLTNRFRLNDLYVGIDATP